MFVCIILFLYKNAMILLFYSLEARNKSCNTTFSRLLVYWTKQQIRYWENPCILKGNCVLNSLILLLRCEDLFTCTHHHLLSTDICSDVFIKIYRYSLHYGPSVYNYILYIIKRWHFISIIKHLMSFTFLPWYLVLFNLIPFYSNWDNNHGENHKVLLKIIIVELR